MTSITVKIRLLQFNNKKTNNSSFLDLSTIKWIQRRYTNGWTTYTIDPQEDQEIVQVVDHNPVWEKS